jgi:ABC-2 type transport system permease protein
MRKVWLIALNILLRMARDRRALLMFLVMPLVLIGILGQALKGMMGDWKLEPFPLAVINADKGMDLPGMPGLKFGAILTDQVLAADGVKKYLQATPATNLEQARQDVAAGKFVAVVYVPPTYTGDAITGKATSIQVVTDPAKPTEAEIVMQVVRGFSEGVTSGVLSGKLLGPEQGAQGMQAMGQVLMPKIEEIAAGVKPVSATQYYAAAMAVMFMVMTAFGRAKEIILERQQGTLSRILISPTARSTVITGQIVGNAMVAFTQFVVLAVGTRLLYGVDWGSWPGALLIGLAFSLASAGIGTTAAAYMNDAKAADAAVGIVGNIFAILSGSMFPIYAFSGVLKVVAQAIPNYWGLRGLTDLMSGFGMSHVWQPVAVLAMIGLVTGAAGAWRLADR